MSKSNAFTIVELLVVLAIIGTLVALLLPAVQSVRETARRSECQNHLRNMALAALNFEAIQSRFPPAAQKRQGNPSSGQKPPLARHNGITLLLPHFEEGTTFDRIDLEWDWNHPKNEPHTKQHLGGILVCPSAPGGRAHQHVTDYVAANRIDVSSSGLKPLIDNGIVDGKKGAKDGERVWDGLLQVDFLHMGDPQKTNRRLVRSSHAKDGLSHTWLWFESAGKPYMYGTADSLSRFSEPIPPGTWDTSRNSRFRWASSDTWVRVERFCSSAGQIINCDNVSNPYSFHGDGANFAFADAAVRFHTADMDAQIFVSLLTLAGREIVSADDL